MSVELIHQIREMAEVHRETRRAVELHEVEAAFSKTSPRGRDRRPTGPVLAAVAAVVVLIVVGGVSLLFATSGETPPADQERTTSTIVSTTTEPESTTEPEPTTQPESTTNSGGELRAVLAELDSALGQEVVLASSGFDIKAELEYLRDFLSDPDSWPDPRFDTSALGEEIAVEGMTIDQETMASAVGDQAEFLLSSPAFVPSENSGEPVVPFVAGAQLPGTEETWVYAIVVAFDSGVVDVSWRLISDVGGMQFGPRGPTEDWEDHLILVHGTDRPDVPVTIAGLPPEASVVSTVYSGGRRVWQKPVNGFAMFNDPGRSCITEEDAEACDGEYTVFDANGSEILSIVFLPIDEAPPFGFRVDRP